MPVFELDLRNTEILRDFLWALLLRTPSREGLYLTVYPLAGPNTDRIYNKKLTVMTYPTHQNISKTNYIELEKSLPQELT